MSAVGAIKDVINAAGDLLFPPHCAVCDTAIESGRWICLPCEAKIQRIDHPRCENCSHPLSGMSGPFICPNCKGQPFHFEFAVSVMRAGGSTRELIHRLKYKHEQRLAVLLGGWLAEGFQDKRLSDFDPEVIVPVPLHPVRHREREFNQSELLARIASKHLGIPWQNLLIRQRHTDTQTQFDRKHRMENLRDAFKLRKNAVVNELRIALVDDVLTTGSTLDECARVLIDGGASRVCAVTVARG